MVASESEVFERIKKIVIERLDVSDASVTLDAGFTEDLGADSLDTVELVMAFEEEFNVEIPDEDAENIKTIRDAVNYVVKAA
ncbi:MAG: acyl carrier protein [Candidatus Sericytochromatia bacterium]|nr:acyl carrier protein [Candidatus Sericytochromatia bacterium]